MTDTKDLAEAAVQATEGRANGRKETRSARGFARQVAGVSLAFTSCARRTAVAKRGHVSRKQIWRPGQAFEAWTGLGLALAQGVMP